MGPKLESVTDGISSYMMESLWQMEPTLNLEGILQYCTLTWLQICFTLFMDIFISSMFQRVHICMFLVLSWFLQNKIWCPRVGVSWNVQCYHWINVGSVYYVWDWCVIFLLHFCFVIILVPLIWLQTLWSIVEPNTLKLKTISILENIAHKQLCLSNLFHLFIN